MTDPLTPARFAELADAYGGAVARWPEDVRSAATGMAAQPEMRLILADAGRLDARLDLWRVACPAPALRDGIVAARPLPLLRRPRLWWSSIGIATALAGAVAGSVAAAAVLPRDHVAADEATAFGDFPRQEN